MYLGSSLVNICHIVSPLVIIILFFILREKRVNFGK